MRDASPCELVGTMHRWVPVSEGSADVDISPTTLGDVADQLFDRRHGWTLYVPAETSKLATDTPALWVYDLFADGLASPAGWMRALGVPELREIARRLRVHILHPGAAALIEAWDRQWQSTRDGHGVGLESAAPDG